MASTINATTNGIVNIGDSVATLALQTGGTTAVAIDTAQIVSLSKSLALLGSTSGSVTIAAPAVAGSTTITLPATSGTLLQSGTAVTVAQGGTGLTAGTSGGVPYFSGTTTVASSAALTANGVVYGGGAGAAPVATAAGTTGQFLGANTGAAPTWQTPSGGGSPGGSTTQVQYNNAGAFGGITQMTYNGTTVAVSNDMTVAGLTIGKGVGSTASNTALGVTALGGSAAGSGNVAVGYQTLNSVNNASAANNTALGSQANFSLTSGAGNIAIGQLAGYSTTTGAANCYIGVGAGYDLTTGSYNIYVGNNARNSTNTVTNEFVVSCNSGSTVTGKGASTGYIYVGAAGGVYQGNNSAAWSVTSDQRIKKNIVNIGDSLGKINALRVVEFDYKENERHEVGFIAQEFEQQFPEQIIRHSPNEAEKEWVGDDQVMGIQHNLVPFLVKAVQELSAANEALTARIAALEAK